MKSKIVFSSASDRWSTPQDVYQALDDEFCFDFDPCPLDGTEDGLAPLYTQWHGRRVFCNPPYGPRLGKWLERGLEANLAVFLIPARTDTRWFHDIVLPNAKEIRFIRGRLKFGNAVTGAPFPSMIVIFQVNASKATAPTASPTPT
jgi:site-specific DNA-methyltransferase (adenine-specific)